jgi:pimeloyl-ACP methyl ester carboxylesterase
MQKFIASDGVKIAYSQTGSGKNLVMVHGYGCSSLYFKRNIPVLAKQFTVTAVDLRGHGESEKTTKGPRVSRLATDIHELLKHLNITDAVYLGWSMGCSVGWSYWDLFQNDRLSKFIFVDEPALGLDTPDNPSRLLNYQQTVDFMSALAANKQKTLHDFINGIVIHKENDVSDLIESSYKVEPSFAGRLFYNHMVTDWSDVLPRINLPALVISGTKSFFNPDLVKATAELLPNASVESFPETGHLMFFEEAERFNRIVTEFIEKS